MNESLISEVFVYFSLATDEGKPEVVEDKPKPAARPRPTTKSKPPTDKESRETLFLFDVRGQLFLTDIYL